ncbi:cysteine hydrolase family protein [Curvibacter sp. APW13]|uniref:cysteine hydrolase family protein n=1 Tax=Curvibacter sp. APW13 TaxID=3077236 RepID=UPI0028DFEBAB|nr:cysteine hydrolase family protein [Curvibacter sp. APW13]MDT8989930.1 cysteine hydrolase family protein [Curvibacter sp. APW13]
MSHPALIVIDIQNDYFPTGAYPLHDTEAVLARSVEAIHRAQAQGVPVVLVQHVARGPSPFFNGGTEGVQIHPALRAAAPDAPVVVKGHADSFLNTTLQDTLAALGADTLWLAGMMTHNCVTHTALSPQAQGYAVRVLEDLCTTVDPMIHAIALSALRDRVEVVRSATQGLA